MFNTVSVQVNQLSLLQMPVYFVNFHVCFAVSSENRTLGMNSYILLCVTYVYAVFWQVYSQKTWHTVGKMSPAKNQFLPVFLSVAAVGSRSLCKPGSIKSYFSYINLNIRSTYIPGEGYVALYATPNPFCFNKICLNQIIFLSSDVHFDPVL